MKGSPSVNSELNKVLAAELVAINQYFLHARMIKNWGYEGLADREFDASIQVMKEADQLIERVLFLEGLPNLQYLGKLSIGQNVPEIIGADLGLETTLRAALVRATSVCEKEADFVSRALLSGLTEESEKRIDFLETQRDLVGQLGLENYLQSATGELGEMGSENG